MKKLNFLALALSMTLTATSQANVLPEEKTTQGTTPNASEQGIGSMSAQTIGLSSIFVAATVALISDTNSNNETTTTTTTTTTNTNTSTVTNTY